MRRFVSLALACLIFGTAAPSAGAVDIPPVTLPVSVSAPVSLPASIPSVSPDQIPIPPGPPTPARTVGSLTVSTSITLSRVRALGIRLSLRMPRGSDTVQITVRSGRRIVVRTYRTDPPRVFRVAETKRLRRGRYTLEIRVGPSRTKLGPASRVTFTVR